MNSNVNRDTHTGARSARRPSIGPRRRHSRPRNHVGFASDVTTNEILGFFFVCLFSLFLVFFFTEKKTETICSFTAFRGGLLGEAEDCRQGRLFALFFYIFVPAFYRKTITIKTQLSPVFVCVRVRVCKRERKKERKKGRTPSSRP